MEKINYRSFDIEPLEFTAASSVREIFYVGDYATVLDLVNELQSRNISLDQVQSSFVSLWDDSPCFVHERLIPEYELNNIIEASKQLQETYVDLCKQFIDDYHCTQQQYNETESRGFSFTSDARAASLELLRKNLNRAYGTYQNQLYNLSNP